MYYIRKVKQLKNNIMKSKDYHYLLLNEYENKELTKDELSSTLKHYAHLYFKERLKKFFLLGWL
jgi:hypothetical protein